MGSSHSQNLAAAPTSDGARVLFEIVYETEFVRCAISRMALEDLGLGRCFKPADMLKCFEKGRGRIEAMAVEKLRHRPESVVGVLSLWSDDVFESPAGSLQTDTNTSAAPL